MESSSVNTRCTYKCADAKDGSMTLLVTIDGREFPLHSRVAPAREAAETAPDPGRYDLVIALGCGLGYSMLPLKDELQRYKRVIIIDILRGIENDIGRNVNTGFLASSRNVQFITGKDIPEIEKFLAVTVTLDEHKGIHVREHSASFKLFPEYYSSVKAAVKRVLDKKASGAATVKAFGRAFLRNALFNAEQIESLHPVSSLAGRFAGFRGLIVSSAPSVESHMAQIRANRNRFVIIAVDSAIPMLEQNGITPELCVSIDPQHRIAEHLLGHRGERTAHVFSIVSPPATVKRYSGFVSLNSHPVSQVIENLYPGITGSIDSSTGSVAGDALALALLCGFESIAMAGFDFSFTHNNIYARGTAYQQRYATMFNTRLRTPESFNAEYIFKSSRGFIESNRYTRRSFTGYRDSLARYIKENCPGRVHWIGGGLLPHGVVPATVDDFISAPVGYDTAERAAEIIRQAERSAMGVDPVKVREFLTRDDVWEELVKESVGGSISLEDYAKLRRWAAGRVRGEA
ncbi:MAG: DUF115 domain-containing protein [Spirochaetes bacterium]|nr:DUF115 domain-containing protein [Spirochaetota bacterium]